jgi:hypothetical protein
MMYLLDDGGGIENAIYNVYVDGSGPSQASGSGRERFGVTP